METFIHGGVCLGSNPDISIDALTILEIIVSTKGAKVIIKALTRGIITKALILEVTKKISFKGLQIRRMASKVVDLKDKLIS